MRMREFAEAVPKPMVPIGYRPILWHVMKYYAHYGHKDFILCLGYKADVIKNYFLEYNECLSNDFVLSQGGKNLELLSSDIHDWNITFVDTGLTSNIGRRLKAVEKHPAGEVKSIEHIGKSGARINGGFMALRQEVFGYMRDGEELVEEPFRRLIG